MEVVKVQAFNSALCLSYSEKVLSAKEAASVVQIEPDQNSKLQLQTELDLVKFKYNAVFNSTPSYCIILDSHLNIVDYNYAAVRMMRHVFNKQLVRGEHVAQYLNNETMKPILGNCKRALAGDTFTVERKIDFGGGQKMSWWQAEYSPAYNVAHQIDGIIFNALDITDRKEREAKIEQQNEKLHTISLMQSHDIRGPLCTLMGLLELMKLEGATPDSTYLPMLEQTIALLDEKVRSIVECANE